MEHRSQYLATNVQRRRLHGLEEYEQDRRDRRRFGETLGFTQRSQKEEERRQREEQVNHGDAGDFFQDENEGHDPVQNLDGTVNDATGLLIQNDVERTAIKNVRQRVIHLDKHDEKLFAVERSQEREEDPRQ